MKKQVLPPSNSNHQSRTLPIKVPQTCNMTVATKQVHPMTKSNPTFLPTMKVNVHDKKKPSTHCWFSQRYDLRVCLDGEQGQAFSEWEAISTLLLQLQAIDNTIKLYPWRCQDHTTHPPIKLATIDNTFFDLQVYVPRLASQLDGWRPSIASSQTRYPYLWLESSVKPLSLVAWLSPWLRETKQGMWIRQLPLVEQTVCLGWLIFSAPEYDRNELRRTIKEMSGEDVALRYCMIQKGVKGHTEKDKTTVKAIHIEVDITLSSAQRQRITSMYSSSALMFPLNIKMQLVPELSAGSTPDIHARGLQLMDRQDWFLTRSTTSKLSLDTHSNLTMAQMMTLLRSMSRTYPSTNQTVTPLFHAVSPMISSKGCLIRYLLQHCSAVLETLAQLQTFLPGFQEPPKSPSICSTSRLQAGLEDPS